MKKNWFFIILLSMAALSLAGTAAYFSVFGLTKLFYAAGLGITILAASLEFAKLVTVSYVYRFWKMIKKGLRGFYVFAVIFIMLLTSIGIYGFLTGAYQQSANKVQLRDSQITIAENKKALFVAQLDRVNKSIESSSNRINTLSGLRTQQERRLDNLYDKNSVTSAKRTESQISGSDEQIKMLNSEITGMMKQTNTINDSIAFYDQKIAELKTSDISNEIGPYKFVADLTGQPIDRIVNIVAILIVLVFDPLAVALLIGVNQLTSDEMYVKNEEEEETEKKKKRFFDKFKFQKKTPIVTDNEATLQSENQEVIQENDTEEVIKEESVKEEPDEVKYFLDPKTEPVIKNEIILDSDPVQSFLDVIETTTKAPEDPSITKIASVKGRINSAHFVPKS